MKTKELKKGTRLSLDDFKIAKTVTSNEIDKLLGGLAVASDCHVTSGVSKMKDGTLIYD